MGKTTIKGTKLLISPSASADLYNVADATAKAALSPASGDYVYVRSTGAIEKYNGSAWVTSTELDYCFTDISLEITRSTVDQIDSCSGDNVSTAVLKPEITLTASRLFKNSSDVALTGKDLTVTYDGTEIAVTELTLNETWTEIQTGDSSDDDIIPYTLGNVKRTIEFTHLQRNDEDDLVTGDTAETLVISFGTGCSFSGSVKLISKSISTSIGNYVSVQYSGEIQGALTPTGIDTLITTDTGYLVVTGSGKTYGTPLSAIHHVSRSITAPENGQITSSESFRINVKPTETKGA
jgi:hypothetical protein